MQNEIFSGLALIVSLFTLLIVKRHFRINKRDKRIDDFIDNLFDRYTGTKGGYAVQNLIPSGINGLENDKEIKLAFEKANQRLSFHPLRKWDGEIKAIGYKKFFNYIVQSGNDLRGSTIQALINDCKNAKKNKQS